MIPVLRDESKLSSYEPKTLLYQHLPRYKADQDNENSWWGKFYIQKQVTVFNKNVPSQKKIDAAPAGINLFNLPFSIV